MWFRKGGRVGRSSRFGLVWSGRLKIQHHQYVSYQGGYRAARAAKNESLNLGSQRVGTIYISLEISNFLSFTVACSVVFFSI